MGSSSGWPAVSKKAVISYGKTDEFGFQAVDNKTHAHDIHTTIFRLMGINHENSCLTSIRVASKPSPTSMAG
ncbi:MAG: DUF1501 domain-containing protein [Verrucomicrobiota bacterium]